MRMYLWKAFDFQRPSSLIWASVYPKAAAWEAAPIQGKVHQCEAEKGGPLHSYSAQGILEGMKLDIPHWTVYAQRQRKVAPDNDVCNPQR